MNTFLRVFALIGCLAVPVVTVHTWERSAKGRVGAADGEDEQVAVASVADVGYCTPQLKRILRRVLMSCGLMHGAVTRGCQPVQAQNVATMSGGDFNALFHDMKDRGGIIQYKVGDAMLDEPAGKLIDEVFADQRGGSWFFVVARSSPEGDVIKNRDLSRARADAVMTHLREKFTGEDLDQEVGLLWLGEEFAQLDDQFCEWRRSAGEPCTADDINRSAFIAWIDCKL